MPYIYLTQPNDQILQHLMLFSHYQHRHSISIYTRQIEDLMKTGPQTNCDKLGILWRRSWPWENIFYKTLQHCTILWECKTKPKKKKKKRKKILQGSQLNEKYFKIGPWHFFFIAYTWLFLFVVKYVYWAREPENELYYSTLTSIL